MSSYQRDDVDRGRRPNSNHLPRGGYRDSPYSKERDDRSERSSYRESYERSSRPSSRSERSYDFDSRTYSPVPQDSRDRYPAHERVDRPLRSKSVQRQEWNGKYSAREFDNTRSVRASSRERRPHCDRKTQCTSRECNGSSGSPRDYHRRPRGSRSPPRRACMSSPVNMPQLREDRNERRGRISPYPLKIRERGKSQPPPGSRHRPPPRSIPSLMEKDLSGPSPKHRDWRNCSNRPVDPRKRPLLPTPDKPPSALFAELVYTGAKIMSAKINDSMSSNHVPIKGQSEKRTLLPLPLSPDDLRNRLDQRVGGMNNSPMTETLSREPNGGLKQTVPNGHASEVANGMSFSYAYGTPNNVGENRVNGAERCPSPVVLYESEDTEVPNLVPIIKQENEGAPESFSEYEGISKQFLFCHLCIKHLPDAMSFESHLTDPAHVSLVGSFELNYKLQLNVLRHNAQLEKQRRDVELERPGTESLKNCAVCDVNFDGSVMVHRKSIHHQRLRRFLNPSCRVCRAEFDSRIERDYHRLSAEHLKALQNQERSLAFEDGDHEVDDLQTIESLDCTVPIGPHQCSSPNHAADEEAVGQSAIQRVAAFYCRVCHKHLPTQSEAYDIHCKTKGHHERYQQLVDNPMANEAS